MWLYWLIFLVPAIAALSAKPAQNFKYGSSRSISITPAWVMIFIALVVIIGFRDRVGGDWFNYFTYLFRAENLTISEAIRLSDPAYEVLNVISLQLGLGVVGVNLFCAIVFSSGLIVFVRSMPRPWLALAVAIPYMTIVVSMGYSRQGVALGFAMIGLVALGRERFLWFAFWIFLASTFHRSAVVLIGISLLTLDFKKIVNLPILLLVASLLYVSFLEDQAENLVTIYIDSEMQSDGAFIRLLMNIVPAILFFIYRKKFRVSKGEYKVYSIMAMIAIATFLALVTGLVPSTAADRMALYLIPLQVFVFANLPDSFSRDERNKSRVTFLILIYYAFVLFVWLKFANFSHWWLPYRMFPPLDIEEAYFRSW
jgi:hypothetical protein